MPIMLRIPGKPKKIAEKILGILVEKEKKDKVIKTKRNVYIQRRLDIDDGKYSR